MFWVFCCLIICFVAGLRWVFYCLVWVWQTDCFVCDLVWYFVVFGVGCLLIGYCV